MSTLRELSQELMEVRELALDPDVPPEALADTLEGMAGLFNDKAVNIAHVLNNADSDIAELKAESSRLSARVKTIENMQKRLKEYLQINMVATGITKITCPLYTITLAKGREVVVIDDVADLPDALVKVTTTVAPVKADIMKAIKAGDDVPGAHIARNEPSVRIK